jgi:hypothetical protein
MSSDPAGDPGENEDFGDEQLDYGGLPDDARPRAVLLEQITGIIGLIGGLGIIIVGIVMIFGKIDGSVDIEIGQKFHLTTVVVGIVVCAFGVAVIWIARSIATNGNNSPTDKRAA